MQHATECTTYKFIDNSQTGGDLLKLDLSVVSCAVDGPGSSQLKICTSASNQDRALTNPIEVGEKATLSDSNSYATCAANDATHCEPLRPNTSVLRVQTTQKKSASSARPGCIDVDGGDQGFTWNRGSQDLQRKLQRDYADLRKS